MFCCTICARSLSYVWATRWWLVVWTVSYCIPTLTIARLYFANAILEHNRRDVAL